MENVNLGFICTAAGWLKDFIGSKYWISYYPGDAQMAWNASLRCSQSCWGCCSSLPRVSFPGHVDWRIPSSLPFLPSLSPTHGRVCTWDKGKVAQWWWLQISRMCLSQIYCSWLLLPVLNFLISDITRCPFEELCLYSEILKRLGVSTCGSSGQQS